jgi:hypothetical protein
MTRPVIMTAMKTGERVGAGTWVPSIWQMVLSLPWT